MSDEAENTYVIVLAGRPVTFKRATLGQVMMLHRQARNKVKAAEENPDLQGHELTDAIILTLDFVEKMIVSPQDRQFVEDQMMEGNIDYLDLVAALGQRSEAPPDDQAPKPVKRAPRKSPKAAPAAKAVASRGRTKR